MKRKNLPELISSLYRIDFFSDPNNRLIMISECISDSNFAFYEKIKQTITKHEDQIHVLLNVPHQEVFEIMKESDIFVMPAINEPAGTSMVEAMACGLGVICSDSNGAKYYIDEGQNGHVFEFTEDLENLDSAILQVMDKELLVRYGKKSLEIIETKHNVERFIELVVH
jgi:glycosyltransferase involved in cell wall biosynthesis